MTRIRVDRDACICSGMCTSAAPDLFDLDDSGELALLLGDDVDVEYADQAHEAADVCPVEAISVE